MADLAERSIAPVVAEATGRRGTVHRREGKWRDSRSICCLADAERHLGHIVRAGSCWLAFDATHGNESAKRAVELGLSMKRKYAPTLQ
jgi:hypothetical protein